jgi:hypothetical protein
VSYPDVIDHVTISDKMNRFYVNNSARILRTEMETLIAGYGTSTSDHYPVQTEYIFDGIPVRNSLNSLNSLLRSEKNIALSAKAWVNGQQLYVIADGLKSQLAQMRLINPQGSQLSIKQSAPVSGKAQVVFQTQQLSGGIYLIQVVDGKENLTIKVMIH